MYELPILAKQTGMDQRATDAHTDTHTSSCRWQGRPGGTGHARDKPGSPSYCLTLMTGKQWLSLAMAQIHLLTAMTRF